MAGWKDSQLFNYYLMAKDFFDKMKSDGWMPLLSVHRHTGQTPKESGVYCFVQYNSVTACGEIIYVGKSIDLSIRLKPGHSIERKYNIRNGLLMCYILLTRHFDQLEIELIKRYKPKFNVKHNPAIRRVILYI